MTAGPGTPGLPAQDWFEVLRDVPRRRPAAFFDRDGTLIENSPYLADSGKVRLEPGAIDAIRAFRKRGFAIVVATNQSGIARGLVTPRQYCEVNARMLELIGPDMVDAIIACPFHPAGDPPWNIADHPWRKPAPGMIDAAIERLGIARSGSVMVGDSLSDMEAGLRAGLARLVHVATGHGRRDRAAVASLAHANKGTRFDCIASLKSLVIEEMAP